MRITKKYTAFLLAALLLLGVVGTLPVPLAAQDTDTLLLPQPTLQEMAYALSAVTQVPVGLQGFEGAYTLDENPGAMVEIIVQFKTPPAVALRLMHEGDTPRGRANGAFEAQALAAHEAFQQELNHVISLRRNEVAVETFGVHYCLFNGVFMRVPAELVHTIATLPEVFAVFPNQKYYIGSARQEGLSYFNAPASNFPHNNEARELFEIDRIHSALGFTGKGVRVAVLDSGVDYNHPSLRPYRDPATNRIRGWDFIRNNNNTMDFHGHGTHVSGTIVAMAPDVELWHFRVLDEDGHGWTTGFLDAVRAARNANIDIINFSIHSDSTNIHNPVNYAFNMASLDGVIVVVIAGNFQTSSIRPTSIILFGTAALPITVAAGTAGGHNQTQDTIASFSSRGPVPGTYHIKPDIVAPGVNIHSPALGGGYVIWQGTSMAAPAIAGIAALMVQAFPNAPPSEVKARLMNTARPLADLDAASVHMVGAGFAVPLCALTRNGDAFATVQHPVPLTSNPNAPFQTQTMSSLSFGRITGNRSATIPITVHNPGIFTWQASYQFNRNRAGVTLHITRTGTATFNVHITTLPGITPDGNFEGNMLLTNGTRQITLPFSANVATPSVIQRTRVNTWQSQGENAFALTALFDNDLSTIWHGRYHTGSGAIAPNRALVDIDFGQNRTITTLAVHKRHAEGRGMIHEMQVFTHPTTVNTWPNGERTWPRQTQANVMQAEIDADFSPSGWVLRGPQIQGLTRNAAVSQTVTLTFNPPVTTRYMRLSIGSWNANVNHSHFNQPDMPQIAEIAVSDHIPATHVTQVPRNGFVGTPLALFGTVMPSNATDRNLTWQIMPGGTAAGATLSGNQLNVTGPGTVHVRAMAGTRFAQDFTITFALPYQTNVYRARVNTWQDAFAPDGLSLGHLFDGNENTFWHGRFSAADHQGSGQIAPPLALMDIDLGRAQWVTQVALDKRVMLGRDMITGLQVYAHPARTNAWPNNEITWWRQTGAWGGTPQADIDTDFAMTGWVAVAGTPAGLHTIGNPGTLRQTVTYTFTRPVFTRYVRFGIASWNENPTHPGRNALDMPQISAVRATITNFIPGDVDGNGVVDMADAALLARYLADPASAPGFVREAALLTEASLASGAPSQEDLTRLLQMLTGN